MIWTQREVMRSLERYTTTKEDYGQGKGGLVAPSGLKLSGDLQYLTEYSLHRLRGERRSGPLRQTPKNRFLTSGILDFHAGLPLEESDLLNESHTPLEEFKNLEIQFVDLAAKRIQPQGSLMPIIHDHHSLRTRSVTDRIVGQACSRNPFQGINLPQRARG
jgi:hypothetical protein